MLSSIPYFCDLSLDIIDFPLSKLMACETSDFQKVLGDWLKCLEEGEHPMADCFVERIIEMIFSFATFYAGLCSLNDIFISFALIE